MKKNRDDQIFELRSKGMTFRHIASLFHLSVERTRTLFLREKYKREVVPTLPPLERVFSPRVKNALVKHFRSDSILEKPHKIAEMDPRAILKIQNIGRKSLKEISSVLYSLNVIKNEDEWLGPFK